MGENGKERGEKMERKRNEEEKKMEEMRWENRPMCAFGWKKKKWKKK